MCFMESLLHGDSGQSGLSAVSLVVLGKGSERENVNMEVVIKAFHALVHQQIQPHVSCSVVQVIM